MTTEIISPRPRAAANATVYPDAQHGKRVLEFLNTQINDDHAPVSLYGFRARVRSPATKDLGDH
jgi:hypothetical protein